MKLQILEDRLLVQIQGGPWGEIAPLPGWSRETLPEALTQVQSCNWVTQLQELDPLSLFPSVHFGLESALLPSLPPTPVPESALFMGSLPDILRQAIEREREGYKSAKLKVSQLTFSEAARAIDLLAHRFYLRIDVNRAWDTEKALQFFSQYPKDLFDYVEEPFKNPHDLRFFPHPLAIDESFPQDFTLADLEELPTLKALIYKPTLQGGLAKARPLYDWTVKRGLQFVLSSSFESPIGLYHIASLALRLTPRPFPLGLGTRHFSKNLKDDNK